jgi:hypothetical protein
MVKKGEGDVGGRKQNGRRKGKTRGGRGRGREEERLRWGSRMRGEKEAPSPHRLVPAFSLPPFKF